MTKAVKIVTNILYILLAVIVLIEAFVYVPGIFGVKPLAVLTGSMEPTYHVGSMVYVKRTALSDIEPGDAVTFYISGNTMVTHRVIAKDDSAHILTTKGDANLNTQESVSYDSVVGKVLFNIPLLGYISSWFASMTGKLIIFGMIIAVLVLSFMPDRGNRKRGKEPLSDGEKEE